MENQKTELQLVKDLERKLYDMGFTVSVIAEPETMNPSDCFDDEQASWIRNELETNSSEWTWCQVTLKIEIDVMGFSSGLESEVYLGGCSYKNADDFKVGGYYVDMIHECLGNLTCECRSAAKRIQAMDFDEASIAVSNYNGQVQP